MYLHLSVGVETRSLPKGAWASTSSTHSLASLERSPPLGVSSPRCGLRCRQPARRGRAPSAASEPVSSVVVAQARPHRRPWPARGCAEPHGHTLLLVVQAEAVVDVRANGAPPEVRGDGCFQCFAHEDRGGVG